MGDPYPSAKMQSVYSTAPADWANQFMNKRVCVCVCVYVYIYIYIYGVRHIEVYVCVCVYSKIKSQVKNSENSGSNKIRRKRIFGMKMVSG